MHSKPYLSMGAVFSLFGGVYYWFEKITGVSYSEFLAQLHFWIFFVGVNLTFFPMHYLGVAGMPRRIPDYPDAFHIFNKIASWGSYISAFSVLIFFLVLLDAFWSKASSTQKELVNFIMSYLVIMIVLVYFRSIFLDWVHNGYISFNFYAALYVTLLTLGMLIAFYSIHIYRFFFSELSLFYLTFLSEFPFSELKISQTILFAAFGVLLLPLVLFMFGCGKTFKQGYRAGLNKARLNKFLKKDCGPNHQDLRCERNRLAREQRGFMNLSQTNEDIVVRTGVFMTLGTWAAGMVWLGREYWVLDRPNSRLGLPGGVSQPSTPTGSRSGSESKCRVCHEITPVSSPNRDVENQTAERESPILQDLESNYPLSNPKVSTEATPLLEKKKSKALTLFSFKK